MTVQKNYPGTPVYHNLSARNGRQATHSVTRVARPSRPLAVIMKEERDRAMTIGFIVGATSMAALFGLILWLWVIPTMDAAVATAQGMVM